MRRLRGVVSCQIILTLNTMVLAGIHERRLLNDLFLNYNKLERPVKTETDVVQLLFTISLQQIVDLDEKNQILTSNIWLNLDWVDHAMVWNFTEYGGVKDIRIPPKLMWKPDLLLYNSANEAFDATFPANIIVRHDGTVSQIPPGIFKSTCNIDITWFPFDDQSCDLKFGTWTYHGFYINLSTIDNGVDTSGFQDNGEWQLLGAKAKRNVVVYDCCPDEPYMDITATIILRRRTLYYFSNLIGPCVLIASMAVLGFNFPPDSGEKVTLEITVLMSLTFFMNMVSELQPPSSETPLIGTYFSCIMIMVASSVVCTIMILNYHHRLANTHSMPRWIAVIFLQWLPWMLRMSRPGFKITKKTILLKNKMEQLEKGDRNSKSLLANVLDMDDDFIPSLAANKLKNMCPKPQDWMEAEVDSYESLSGMYGSPRSHCSNSSPGDSGGSPGICNQEHLAVPGSIERELQCIRREISVVADKIRADAEAARIESEWKFAAMVLDRLCLLAFTGFTLILSAAVLIAAPHVFVV